MSFIHASTIANRIAAAQLGQACMNLLASQDASFQQAAIDVNAYFALVNSAPASIDVPVASVASDPQAFMALYQWLGYDVTNDGIVIIISVPT